MHLREPGDISFTTEPDEGNEIMNDKMWKRFLVVAGKHKPELSLSSRQEAERKTRKGSGLIEIQKGKTWEKRA